ncbi:uncharacterized protein BO88DRAFT_466796 [Aspergillus vadensis CBS 113365]|uniref:cyclin-dependent kinase n=1 Tax=Aspergillus vadensis (strain CBS 113365 / IMI 142717 / IBT 24658) TaxID=1448311 RepID=A0A319BN90_ASPVC|nr:hypothetical protein BO88DRAFT_466796 [Aspergillus vadensis CBS 113365]PYH67193.1 hypothetical protein BO88DRAFT_466796 [Aspergillus vadensis CBS 113365]
MKAYNSEIHLDAEGGVPSAAIWEAPLLILHDVVNAEDKLVLDFEYMDKDSKHYIDARGKLLDTTTANFSPHEIGILHWYLKTENLLLDQNGRLELVDFGRGPPSVHSRMAWLLCGPHTPMCCFEVAATTSALTSGPSDVLWLTYTGSPLFAGRTEKDQLLKSSVLWDYQPSSPGQGSAYCPNIELTLRFAPLQCLQYLILQTDPRGIDLLGCMLQLCPKARISAADACSTSGFKDVPDVFR